MIAHPLPPEHLHQRLAAVEAIVLDVDGVLTDGRFWWAASGEEYKQFSFTDVMAISLARKAFLRIGLISGEESPLINRFAEKLEIEDIYQGAKDKASCLRDFVERRRLDLSRVCYMGDDVNDLQALALAGVAVAPRNASPSVKAQAHWVTRRAGGNGAVREVVDALLACKTNRAMSERTSDPQKSR